MAKILLVSDAQTVLEEFRSVLDDGVNEITELRSGELVRGAVKANAPDLVVTDCQVQNMGGIAICLDLKLEESGGRMPHIPVLVVLDRRADVFLAKRALAEGFLVKPLDPIRLRHAAASLLAGGTYRDDSYQPFTVARS
jgi:DNA-binding NarL/FixJ family response regulator